MFLFKKKKENEELVITRIDSPKVVREKKSTEFDASGASRASPRTARRERGEGNLHKTIFDQNTSDWQLRYKIENADFAKGAYGKILLATDKTTNSKVAIKKIPQTTPIRMINNEVRAGKLLGSHPNVASLYQYIDRPDFHYLVFQYIKGEDMFSFLEKKNFNPQDEDQVRSIAKDICEGLKHIHSQNIAHRDIKLENLMISTEGQAAIIDFGLCAFIEQGRPCKEWCGSDNYLAPEICRRIPYDGFKADVFSTGVVLFSLIFGVFPFDKLRVNSAPDPLKGPLRKLKVRFPADVNASESVKQLLTKMLADAPEERCTIEEALNSEWMKADSTFDIKNSCEASHVRA